MTAPGFCSICNFETVKFGDVKPYLLDRTDEFSIYDKDNEGYAIMCCNCWNEQDEMDRLLFGEMKIPIKPLTWEKHLPQHHQQAPPTIIKNIVINHNTNNTNNNYNTSNLIPTYNTNNINTTNNNTSNLAPTYNTTNKITKIIDPDGIIDFSSPEYHRILKRANKYKAEREAKEKKEEKERLERERRDAKERLEREKAEAKEKAEQIKQEIQKQLLLEKYNVLENFDDASEEQQCALREKEQLLEEKRKKDLHDNQIKLEIAEAKRIRKQKKDKENSEIEAIEKGYNVTFEGRLSSVEQPDEILKKYNGGLLTCLICSHCNVMKAYPNGYLDTYGRLNENRTSSKDVCSECIYEKSQKEIDNRLCNMVKCKCGIKYYGATHEAKLKHEASEKHLKALERNKRINGKIYSAIQLRKICNANLNEDRTLKIVGASRMQKKEIIDKLLKIENLVIPEGL